MVTPLTTENVTNQFLIILMPNLNNIFTMNQDLIEEIFQIIEFTAVSTSSLHTDMVSRFVHLPRPGNPNSTFSHWILNI